MNDVGEKPEVTVSFNVERSPRYRLAALSRLWTVSTEKIYVARFGISLAEWRILAIVGTDLRSIERVTGRLTRKTAALAGALSGFWVGLFVGIAFALFSGQGQVGFLFTTPILGAAFGLAWGQVGFSAISRGGTRDFSSVSQVVATRYEVLVEHKLADPARELLAGMATI